MTTNDTDYQEALMAERRKKSTYRFLFWVALAIAAFNVFAAADPAEAAPSWRRAAVATWYGPGFYGNRTACGQRYHIALPGVASNRLRCGTIVEMKYRPRGARRANVVRVAVIDTGGFSHEFDLSAWTARKLCGCRRPYTIYGLPYRVLG